MFNNASVLNSVPEPSSHAALNDAIGWFEHAPQLLKRLQSELDAISREEAQLSARRAHVIALCQGIERMLQLPQVDAVPMPTLQYAQAAQGRGQYP